MGTMPQGKLAWEYPRVVEELCEKQRWGKELGTIKAWYKMINVK